MQSKRSRVLKSVLLILTLLIQPIVVAPAANAAACNPTTTTSDGYTYLAFKTAGTCTWTVPAGVTSIEYLVVAGGGAGSSLHGGGGGAGGLLEGSQSLSGVTTLDITVGDGGTAPAATDYAMGGSGGNSVITVSSGSSAFTHTAIGGGRGASTTPSSGGSGGGVYGGNTPGSGTAGQGNAGAGGTYGANYWSAGGGGGAGSAGLSGSSTSGGSGGNGKSWVSSFTPALAQTLLGWNPANTQVISGSEVYFAGGGGGGIDGGTTESAGGLGGGGTGGSSDANAGSPLINSGGGGGGGGSRSYIQATAGARGVVIIRYGVACNVDKISGVYSQTIGQYVYVSFKNVSTCVWPVPAGVTSIEYLVVGGGGGGGANYGGGGGAGGVLSGTTSTTNINALEISLGAAGVGGQTTNAAGAVGGNTRLRSSDVATTIDLVAAGGGGGGTATTPPSSGGSGGGAYGNGTGATGIPGQGFGGGNGGTSTTRSGGGGGATAVGSAANSTTYGGWGGAGSTWVAETSAYLLSLVGYNVGSTSMATKSQFAIGGSGGGLTNSNGSGAGGDATKAAGTPRANMGHGGGGGGEGTYFKGGNGSAGTVFLRYNSNATSQSILFHDNYSSTIVSASNFDTTQSVALPTLNRASYTHLGWSLTTSSQVNVGAPGTSFSPLIASGLIGRYELDQSQTYSGTGNTVTDLAANVNSSISGSVDSALTGSPVFNSTDKYLDFDGSGSKYMITGSYDSRLQSDPADNHISFFAWIYPKANDGVIVSEYGEGNESSGWHATHIEMVGGKIKFGVWTTSGRDINTQVVTSASTLALNKWYYVGYTYDGTSLKGYVNGTAVGSTVTLTRLTPDELNPVQDLHYAFGRSDTTHMGSGSAGNYRLGSFHVYNKGLSTAEVSNNYQASCYRFAKLSDNHSTCYGPVLYAIWGGSISVTYNVNGGTGSMPSQAMTSSVPAVLNSNSLTRPGYTFGGWNTAANGSGTSYADGATVTLAANTTLYAQWTADPVTVTFNSNFGTPTTATQSILRSVATNLTSNAFTQPGYTFGGWNTAADGSGTTYLDGASITTAAALTLYAQWSRCGSEVVTTGLILHLDSGSSCDTAGNAIWEDSSGLGRNATLVASPSYSISSGGYYSFNAASDLGQYASLPTGFADFTNGISVSFYANFQRSVSWASVLTFSGATTIEDSISVSRYGTNNNLILEIYRGTQSSGFCHANNSIVNGTWRHYAVTVTSAGVCQFYVNGQAVATTSSGTIVPNNVSRSRNFIGMSPSATGQKSGILISDIAVYNTQLSAANVQSNFAVQSQSLSVTFDANGGTGTLANQNLTINLASQLTANSYTRTGYTFGGWNTAANGSGTSYADGATVTLAANTTLYAQWTADPVTVTFNSNFGTPTTATQSILRSVATNLTSNAFTQPGYTFGGWNTAADGSGTTYLDGASITTAAALTLYAQWSGNSIIISYNPGANGSGQVVTQTFTYGSVAPVKHGSQVSGITRTNYSIIGWSLTDGGSMDLAFGENFTGSSNTTLYPVWAQSCSPTNTSYIGNGTNGTNGVGYQVVKFTTPNSCVWTIPNNLTTIDLLVVGAGGGGGAAFDTGGAGGGGGGQVKSQSALDVSNLTDIFITVGAGGAAGTYSGTENPGGAGGTSRVFYDSSLIFSALGGDGGARSRGDYLTPGRLVGAGGAAATANTPARGGAMGGNASSATAGAAGGGGGAAGAGGTATSNNPGLGGAGISSYLTGSSVTYGAGGNGADGGTLVSGVNGGANTGKGGSGASAQSASNASGGAGGSGLVIIRYVLQSYAITFDANGGAGSLGNQTIVGGTPTALSSNVFTKTGYTFSGWNTAADGSGTSYADGSNITVNSNVTLYAQWAAAGFTVTYNLGGGSGSIPPSISKTTGAVFATPSATGITKTGYSFSGWSDGSTTVSAGSNFTMPAGNLTLTAQWTINNYSVSYNLGGGNGTVPTANNRTFNTTVTVAAPTGITRSGYDFAGWSNGLNTFAANSTFTMPANNVTLTATWTPSTYTITYDANGGTGSAHRPSDLYIFGTPAIALSTAGSLAKNGYDFAGWSTSANGSSIVGNYAPAGNVTLYAVWSAQTYTITLNTNGASGSPSTSSLNYTYASPALTLPTVGTMIKTGKAFAGWSTTANGAAFVGPYTTNSDVTLYAVWSNVSYSVTYDLAGGTSALPSETSKHYLQTFSLAAAPTRPNFQFIGWSDGSSTYSANTTYSMPARNIDLTATWVAVYTVAYVGNGATNTLPADRLEADQTVIALANTPTRPGYSFNGWKDQSNTSYTALANMTVSANSHIVTANWSPVQYTVTYNTAGGSAAPTETSKTVGQSFAVAAAPSRTGYVFSGWWTGAFTLGPGAIYVVGTENISMTAMWVQESYGVRFDLNRGTSAVPTEPDHNYADTFNLPVAPVRPGYNFSGWHDGFQIYAAGSQYSMPDRQVTFFAVWVAANLSATFDANGANESNPANIVSTIGQTITLPAALTRTGRAFRGWSDGVSIFAAGSTYTMTTGSPAFTATWSGQLYSISVDVDGAVGTIPSLVDVEAGDLVIVPALGNLAKTGFTFAGWRVGQTTYQPGDTFTMPGNGIQLAAIWNANVIAPVITVTSAKAEIKNGKPVISWEGGLERVKARLTDSKGSETLVTLEMSEGSVLSSLIPGEAYTAVLMTESGAALSINPLLVISPPAAPTSVSYQKLSGSSVKLNWVVSGTAVLYEVTVKTGDSDPVTFKTNFPEIAINTVQGKNYTVSVKTIGQGNYISDPMVYNFKFIPPALSTALAGNKGTAIRWDKTANTKKYTVTVNGKVACITKFLVCTTAEIVKSGDRVVVSSDRGSSVLSTHAFTKLRVVRTFVSDLTKYQLPSIVVSDLKLLMESNDIKNSNQVLLVGKVSSAEGNLSLQTKSAIAQLKEIKKIISSRYPELDVSFTVSRVTSPREQRKITIYTRP